MNVDFRQRTTTIRGAVPLPAVGMTLRYEPITGVLPDKQSNDKTRHQNGEGHLYDGFPGNVHSRKLIFLKFMDAIRRRRAVQHSADQAAMLQKFPGIWRGQRSQQQFLPVLCVMMDWAAMYGDMC